MPEGDSARPARPDSPASEPAGFGREAASESLIGQAAAAATVAVIAAAAIATAPRLRRFFRLPRPPPAIATSAGDSSQRPRAATRPCGLAILLDYRLRVVSIPSHRRGRPRASRRPQRNALNEGPQKKGVWQASRGSMRKGTEKLTMKAAALVGLALTAMAGPFLGSGPPFHESFSQRMTRLGPGIGRRTWGMASASAMPPSLRGAASSSRVADLL